MDKKREAYEVLFYMADDYYSARMTLRFFDREGDSIYEEIRQGLKQSKIVYGIDEARLKEVCLKREDVFDLLIAKGQAHINGVDAEIREMVNFNTKARPSILDNGNVDFKNMNYAKTVSAGDLLALKIPLKEGKNGMTVTGKEIKYKPGKDKQITYGENTIISDDGLELRAEIDGIPQKNNGRISVVGLIELSAVGPETGNIYFSGDVHVKENVLDGYTIQCDGDLTIDGVVEGCIIKVKGNLIVGKGILGHGVSDIVVHGNLISKFIENANVYVKGEIETGEIINSTVLCDSKITVTGKKGLIIGGEITSKYRIDANRIGSKLGVITLINLGINASAITELKLLKETVQELMIIEGKLKKQIPAIEARLSQDPQAEKVKNTLKQYKDSLLSTQLDIEEKTKRLDRLMDALKNVNEGKIKTNSIYPDTVVKIGNSSYFIDHALRDCIITKEDNKVIAIGSKE